jgi:hypothetical protein
MRRSGQYFALGLGAVLLAATVGFAIAPWRAPARTLAVSKGEPAATAPKRKPADGPIASKGKPTAREPAHPPIEIKCRISLASCRKWIALQEEKGRVLMHSAQR